MKRTMLILAMLALTAGFLTTVTGCASSRGRYFQNTRHSQPHVFRNRIYHPADYRYDVTPPTKPQES